MSARRVTIRSGQSEIDARVVNDRVDVGDHTLQVEPLGHERLRITSGDRSTVASVLAGPDGAVWVHVDGHTWKFDVDAAEARRREGASLDHQLLAPMPASVRTIAVREGDRVQTGTVLVTLEAMKMELPIRAPRDGVVQAICCREGELVQAGQRLVELA